MVEGASIRATKSLEIIEGSLVAIGEAVAIARASITREILPFGVVILILFLPLLFLGFLV